MLQHRVTHRAPIAQAVEEDVTLRGGERMRVRLKFRGLQAGLLKVTGLSWQLEGLAKGCKALQVHDLPQLQSRCRLLFCQTPHELGIELIWTQVLTTLQGSIKAGRVGSISGLHRHPGYAPFAGEPHAPLLV